MNESTYVSLVLSWVLWGASGVITGYVLSLLIGLGRGR